MHVTAPEMRIRRALRLAGPTAGVVLSARQVAILARAAARAAAEERPADTSPPGRKPEAGQARPVVLTADQLRVLRLVAYGLGTAEVGVRLGVSAEAAKRRVRGLLEALGVSGRVQAVAAGYELGLLGGVVASGPESTVGPSRGPRNGSTGPLAPDLPVS